MSNVIKEWCEDCKGTRKAFVLSKRHKNGDEDYKTGKCPNCQGKGYTELEAIWSGEGKINILEDSFSRPVIYPLETIGKKLSIYIKEVKE